MYDDVLYFEAARSLLATGRFSYAGEPIVDWPPGFPGLLAGLFALVGPSVAAGKVLVLASVLVASVCLGMLFRREERRFPLGITLAWCVLPTSFLAAARLMSEWPFAALSLCFLYSLDRMRATRAVGWIFASALLFAAAILVRYAGVILGVAVLAQLTLTLRGERTRRAIASDLFVGLVGAVAFVGWELHARSIGTARYHRSGFLSHANPQDLLTGIADLIFEARKLGPLGDFGSIAVPALGLSVLCLATVGLVARVRAKKIFPSDCYAVAGIGLFLVLEWKFARYLIPLAPWIFSWVIDGWAAIQKAAHSIRPLDRLVPAAVALWFLAMLLGDGLLIARGNLRDHGGLSLLASPTPETFYRGYWLELYRASRAIAERGRPGDVLLIGSSDTKHVYAFSGRRCTDAAASEAIGSVLVLDPARAPELVAGVPITLVGRFGAFALYER